MARFALVALMQLALVAPSHGDEVQVVTGSAATIAAEAWTITGFDSMFELTDDGLGGEFSIDRITLPESGQAFDDIRVSCGSITLTTRTVTCAKAMFSLPVPGIGRQAIPGAFSWDRRTGSASIVLESIAVAGGRIRCDITASDAGIEGTYMGTQLALAGLLEVAGHFSDAFAGYSATGLADISGTFSAPSNQPLRVVVSADLDAAALANDAGTVAADGVAGTLDLDVTLEPDRVRFDLGFASRQGEAYLEPVYANFSESALRLEADNVTTADFSVFDAPQFRLQQVGLLDMTGSARLEFPTEPGAATAITADVELRDASIANLYANLVRIAAAGTMFEELDIDGRLSGSVRVVEGALRSANVRIDAANIDDRGGRFALYDLNGTVDWTADEQRVPGASRLRWGSGSVYRILFGGSAVDLQLGNRDVELLGPLRLPMAGGAILVNELVLNDFGSEAATGTLDAELEPVNLGQLTGAFGWPAFSGRVSGQLPLLQLRENTITVGGKLSARAFDGAMELSDLRIEQPFGLVPRMEANLAFRDLDLERVTEAFSFGLIQGRLSVDVTGLTMENWSPVAMDMHLYSPADDSSPHRISQRAIENLSSVGGGGAGAVLSTGFLKFFDVFAYDEIGLRCVLRAGICSMSGVGPAGQGPAGRGYYIVKGSGLPRIDVVGYRNAVSWSRLVQQLAAITRSGVPTVN